MFSVLAKNVQVRLSVELFSEAFGGAFSEAFVAAFLSGRLLLGRLPVWPFGFTFQPPFLYELLQQGGEPTWPPSAELSNETDWQRGLRGMLSLQLLNPPDSEGKN